MIKLLPNWQWTASLITLHCCIYVSSKKVFVQKMDITLSLDCPAYCSTRYRVTSIFGPRASHFALPDSRIIARFLKEQFAHRT